MDDIEIAFRESAVTRSGRSIQPTSPVLLNYGSSEDLVDPTAHLRSPFSPALGLQIGLEERPHFAGTGGLYFYKGSDAKQNRLLILTARHVVLPPKLHRNKFYDRKNRNTRRTEVIHLGTKAHQNALDRIAVQLD